MKNKQKGITLVALVITIVILLILVGITIHSLMGNNGIIAKARWSAYVTEYEEVNEATKLYAMNEKTQEIVDANNTVTDKSKYYPVKGNNIESTISVEFKNYIKKLENIAESDFSDTTKVDLRMVDFTKISLEVKKDYAINIATGMLYSVEPEEYNKTNYYTPKIGMGESKEGITINFYSNNTKVYTQTVAIDKTSETLKTISEMKLSNNGVSFIRWKDITSDMESKNANDENADEEDVEADNEYYDDELADSSENDESGETEEVTYDYYYDGDTILLEGNDIYLEAEWADAVIVLDANTNGGTVNGAETINWTVKEGEEYGELPDAVSNASGYVFSGWYTAATGGEQITAQEVYTSSANISNLYAQYENTNIATITYDAVTNGGTCTKVSKQVIKGKKIGTLPSSKQTTKSTYNFDCWTLEDGTKINSKYVVTDNMTIYARFTIHINFDYQGGTYNPNYRKNLREYKNVKIGDIRGNLYTYEKRTGYKGNGWWTEPNGQGTKLLYNTKITQTSDFTIYADWLAPCTISYDLNYENAPTAPDSKIIYQKNKYGTLPQMTRLGYDLVGWYTDPVNGELVNNTDLVTDSITLYAHWEFKDEIIVSVDGDDTNGNGTILAPYKTLEQAISVATTNSVIHILEGEYTLSPVKVNSKCGAGIWDGGKALEIYGENEKTILTFKGSSTSLRDGNAVAIQNKNTIIRNFVYVFYPKNSSNYSKAIFRLCRGTTKNIFFSIAGSNKASYLYYNDQTSSTKNNVINCTFFHIKGGVDSNYSGLCNFKNIATNVTTKGTNTNVITKAFGTSTMTTEELIEASKENEDFKSSEVEVFFGEHAWK